MGWALSRWLDIRLADQLHLSFPAVLLGVLASLPLLAGLRWTLRTSSKPIRRLVELVQDQLGPLVASCSVAELALVLTSTAFGLAHFLTFSYALLAALAGLYLGVLYWAQGNLLIPIVAHALYDLVALMQLGRMHRARTNPE